LQIKRYLPAKYKTTTRQKSLEIQEVSIKKEICAEQKKLNIFLLVFSFNLRIVFNF